MRKSADYILSNEVAQEQLDLMLDFYDIDPEENSIDEAQEKGVKTAFVKLRKAIRLGVIEIKETDGKLQVKQNFYKDKEKSIEYKTLTGQAKIGMGKKGDKDFHGRMYALLGYLSGLGERAILNLEGKDLSVAECLGMLFLVV